MKKFGFASLLLAVSFAVAGCEPAPTTPEPTLPAPSAPAVTPAPADGDAAKPAEGDAAKPAEDDLKAADDKAAPAP